MTKVLGGLLTLAVLGAVGLFAIWFFLIRSDAPPPVNLDAAVSGVTTSTPSSDASGTPDDPDGSIAQPDGYEGTWVLDPSGSFVGYRVREELAGIGATTAVGRTSDVSGSVEFDGEVITGVEIVADLSTLQSDDSRRDGQLRRQALETDRFPEGTFSLSEPIDIGEVPADGVTIAATAVGDLTLHGVTQTVEVPLEGRLVGEAVVVVGSINIAFADYDISPPTAGVVLSVEDEAVMELSLVFRRG
jgi:polyisoprenoid-binding protein YceI